MGEHMESNYQRYADAVPNLTRDARDHVTSLVDKATGYVWGWQDAGGARSGKDKTEADAWEFPWAYGLLAIAHHRDQHGLSPIQNVFAEFLAGKDIVAHLSVSV